MGRAVPTPILVRRRPAGPPYNRITRNWIYKTSQGERNNIGFGTQSDMDAVGSVVFLPSTFTDKAAHERVAVYARTLIKETLMLSESCGYTDPAQIKSQDVMIQVQPGRFECLEDLMTV